MTKDNNDRATTDKDNHVPPLSPGKEGQDADASTNNQTNKTTATDTIAHLTFAAKTREIRKEISKPLGFLPNNLAEIKTPNPTTTPTS